MSSYKYTLLAIIRFIKYSHYQAYEIQTKFKIIYYTLWTYSHYLHRAKEMKDPNKMVNQIHSRSFYSLSVSLYKL